MNRYIYLLTKLPNSTVTESAMSVLWGREKGL